jgi:GNAT superfamily N-acetyltransferase
MTQATQDICRHVANCFLAIETATRLVVAHYTIATASNSMVDLPPEYSKHLPRYATVPAVRAGRSAVDQNYQARGLGKALLVELVTLGNCPHDCVE